jgi:hypothetical protein
MKREKHSKMYPARDIISIANQRQHETLLDDSVWVSYGRQHQPNDRKQA